jgi:2-octaprenyl-6-methoxyphenol hydroxylase
MKELYTDILIVGGGLTGLMTAYTLSALKKEIIIVDKFDYSSKVSNLDFRTTAISEGSKEFFDQINIWKDLSEYAEKIKYICVNDRNKTRNINFQNLNTKSFLGYIINNNLIKQVLIKNLKNKKNIKVITNQSFVSLNNNNNSVDTFFSDYKINSSFLVAADGKKSSIRNKLKLPIFKKKYTHKAIVINFHHTKDHKNTAHELFFKSGPLAILPMKKIKKFLFSSSVIWSNENSFISNLAKVNKNFLKLILQEKISSQVGSIEEIVSTQIFDLSAHLNYKFYDKRLVFIGDSAHSIHPIAGQGWNLGVRDIKNCYQVLCEAKTLGLDIGSVFVCQKYHDLCYNDAFNLYQITDKLNSIFINDSFLVNFVRSVGFDVIEKNQNIKKFITNYAMGLN